MFRYIKARHQSISMLPFEGEYSYYIVESHIIGQVLKVLYGSYIHRRNNLLFQREYRLNTF